MSIKETIRAEIERRRDFFYKRFLKKGIGCVEESRYDECVEILSFIDSLPDCKVCTKGNGRVKDEVFDSLLEQDENAADKKAVKEIVKTVHKEVTRQVKEMVKEQPFGEGLEEEISRTYHDGSVTDTDDIDHTAYENIARHFAEWGAEHLKR